VTKMNEGNGSFFRKVTAVVVGSLLVTAIIGLLAMRSSVAVLATETQQLQKTQDLHCKQIESLAQMKVDIERIKVILERMDKETKP